jgi:lysophospholipase L1-like esterase
MKLQTNLSLKKQTHHQIDYSSKIFLVGSCFSENIGAKLSYYKFQSEQNPFGILFHPKAIQHLIKSAIQQKVYTENDLIFNNERWHSLDAHSSLSSADKNEVLTNLNAALVQTKKQLEEASHIIITLGTSWVYRFLETDTIVANCHKISQKKFSKELLSVAEVSETLHAILSLIKAVNSKARVLFTISPIRHLKDGFIENMRSKAHLISGVHETIASETNASYFPSYEIVMDELREYRFYTEDLLHPNKTAINYIWEKFIGSWCCEASKETMQEIETIQKGLSHKSFNEKSEQHQQLLKNLKKKKELVRKKHPFISF